MTSSLLSIQREFAHFSAVLAGELGEICVHIGVQNIAVKPAEGLLHLRKSSVLRSVLRHGERGKNGEGRNEGLSARLVLVPEKVERKRCGGVFKAAVRLFGHTLALCYTLHQILNGRTLAALIGSDY